MERLLYISRVYLGVLQGVSNAGSLPCAWSTGNVESSWSVVSDGGLQEVG